MSKRVVGLLPIVCILGSALGGNSLALASIKALPAPLKASGTSLESSHSAGIGVFFRSLEEEDCDKTTILDQKFIKSASRAGAAALFRIESRVEAHCQRREVWHCRSVYEGSGLNNKSTYKYTDCETDAPLVED